MRSWKIALVGAIVGAALIFTAVYQGSNSTERSPGSALAADRTDSPKTPAPEETTGGADPSKDLGWGPFRTTDW